MAWKPLSSSQLLLLARYLWFCIAIIYMSCYLASQLSCCVYQYKYIRLSYLSSMLSYLIAMLSFIMGYLPTLAVPFNKIFPILLAFDLKELQIICKPRHMKCFQTIFSNSYLATDLATFFPMFLQLARLDLMFTCRKNILFYVEFSILPVSSYVTSFINCYISCYMPHLA